MQPPTQDFVNGIDYTTQDLSGSLLNSGFAFLSGNTQVDGGSGVVPVIWTLDTALGVPNVPDPTSDVTAIKWKHYIWFRLPFNTDAASAGIIYTWNDASASVPTFAKWKSTAFDDAAILAQLAVLATNVATALNAANTANANSSNALNQASAAVTVATNAAGQIATVQTQANAASTAAAQANTLAQQASSLAQSAVASANAAVSAATANKLITQITSGTSGQSIRTNDAGSSLEYFNIINSIAVLQEQQALGAPGTLLGQGQGAAIIVKLNTKVSDTGGLVTNLSAGGVFTLAKGIYRVSGVVTIARLTAGTSLLIPAIQNTGTSAIIFYGAMCSVLGTTAVAQARLEGFITSAGGDTFALVLSNVDNTGPGQLACGLPQSNNGAGTKPGVEMYSQISLQKIG